MPEGESFLPRIQSVFYAVFDHQRGPMIVHQVPEGLIGVPYSAPASGSNSVPPTPSTESPQWPPFPPSSALQSRNSSTSLISPSESHRTGPRPQTSSPQQKRSASAHRTLFNFSDISMHRIIGFPVEHKGDYPRNYFRYNLCFVFEREADLSCYEPIVRKVSRVLKSCEEESKFLSEDPTSPAMYPILEQLYEDLNSYSETSIQIDKFNSIELKIFPFYPNPPPVKDWMVPLALINLSKRIEDNWDLTMLKVCKLVDGVNHVGRIAHLADCDISLARQAISHLLYFQVIMMIDIFQYSNMYTLRRNIQWLADEAHVKEECGPYVTKPGRNIPDWPRLLHLYSRFRPGRTVYEWMEAYDVEDSGIDVRRFTSFGVVKGFLRRVHRYPVYMPPDPSQTISGQLLHASESVYDPIANSELARKRGKSLSGTSSRLSAYSSPTPIDQAAGQTVIVFPTTTPDAALNGAVDSPTISATHRARRASAAEKVLEQLRSRDMQKSGSAVLSSPRTSWLNFQQHEPVPVTTTTTATATASPIAGTSISTVSASISSTLTATPFMTVQESPVKGRSESRRLSLTTPVVPPPSPVLTKVTLNPSRTTRSSRSPSIVLSNQPIPTPGPGLGSVAPTQPAIPPELIPLLDGDHHTDELSTMFEAGWPLLEQWLISIGGGQGDGDYGRVAIIYR